MIENRWLFLVKNMKFKKIIFDEMWSFIKVRKGKNRHSIWIWNLVAVTNNGAKYNMFAVGNRDKKLFKN